MSIEMDCMRDQINEGTVLNGRYLTVSPLNHGSFGVVYLARDLNNDDFVAIKCITKPVIEGYEFHVEDVEELKYHSLMGAHPNIVNLRHSFETETHMFIVLEYCSMGDLYEAIRFNKGPMEREHVRDFMLQLVSAVEHMHAKGVYHRDIKPENIFLAQDGTMKLGDFGLATTEEESNEASVGSDRYMAPEQYDVSEGPYNPAQADIWALGVCLLNILFQRNPFAVPSTEDILYSDFKLDRQTLFDIFPTMTMDTYEVLNHSMVIDPSKRSLEKMRRAIELANSWTTDDEIYDDQYCTEDREPVIAAADREPLRTPSINTVNQVNNGTSFPWAKALLMSPQYPQRQLSTIHDEHIFADDDDTFVQGSLDSGLGESLSSMEPKNGSPFKSTSFFNNSRIELIPPRPINTKVATQITVTSVDSPLSPIYFSNASVAHIPIAPQRKPSTATIILKQDSGISTSWSDLVDEEEEEEEINERERIQAMNMRNWSWGSKNNAQTFNKYARRFHDEEEEELFHLDKFDNEEECDWVADDFDSILV